MTLGEVAKILEVSLRTVQDLCRTGLIGRLPIGTGRGTIRITPEDATRFQAAASAKATSPRTASLTRPSDTMPLSEVAIPPALGHVLGAITRHGRV
jgi:hypothetical protein